MTTLVGVRNSDQALDLRLRNAAAQTCHQLSRRHEHEHPAFGCLALGARAEPPGLDLSACDSDFILIRFAGRCPARALERARLAVSGRRPARAKPQVTGVIGVSDPYRFSTVIEGIVARLGLRERRGLGFQAETEPLRLHQVVITAKPYASTPSKSTTA
jgi:hypothetical protein